MTALHLESAHADSDSALGRRRARRRLMLERVMVIPAMFASASSYRPERASSPASRNIIAGFGDPGGFQ